MKNHLHLENYEFVFCPRCNTNAKWPETFDGFNPCVKCGGFGFIMQAKHVPKKRQKLMRPTKDVLVSYEA
jgi:hypothetical protein